MGLINRGTAAKRYDVRYETLKQFGDWGALKVTKRGRYVYFDREELEELLKKRKMGIYRNYDPDKDDPKPAPKSGDKPDPVPGEDGKTPIKNSCGHTWRYNIKRETSIKWLEGRPCPKCAGGKMPKDDAGGTPEPEPAPIPEPEPTPEPDVDEEFVSAIMGKLPEAALYHASLPDLILLLQANVPVWLQGPPGTSKSTLAEQAAEALDRSLYPLPCHEQMSRTDLFGYRDAAGTEHRTPLWDAYEFGGIFLLDEVDNGNSNLIAALNSALSNGRCVFGSGTVVERHADFGVITTANTAGLGPEEGYIGRMGVDLATRDRFVTVDVPIDDKLESALAALFSGEEETVGKARHQMFQRARKAVERRSREAQRAPNSEQITGVVREIRKRVAARHDGLVVSPRATIHTAAMVKVGFTLIEALESKLPGLKPDEVVTLTEGLI